jgi:MFS transporter, OFA family, oxalate/formate antiporter
LTENTNSPKVRLVLRISEGRLIVPVKKSALFYGYVVVAGCFAIQATGIGSHMAFGVFFKPLLADFGWPRAALAGAHSMAFMLMGLLGIFMGRLNDRFGPRVLLAVTALFFGMGLFLMSTTERLWQVYLFYGVIVGIGLSPVDVIALSTTARWFVRRRSMMTGIVKVGTGTGQLVIPLAASFLIMSYGWRTSYILMAVFATLMLAGMGQLLRRDPSQKGLLPDGDTQTASAGFHLDEKGLSLQEALKTRQFWTIFFTNLTVVFSLMIIMVHIVPHAMDMGLPATVAASVLSTIAGASMVGRFLIGIAADRAGIRACMIFCFTLLILAFLWLQVAKELWMLYLFACVYGIGHGGHFTMISPWVAEHVGIRSHGVLFGIVLFAGNLGGAAGPILAGHLFDITGSYSSTFWICAVAGFTALGLILSLRHKLQF